MPVDSRSVDEVYNLITNQRPNSCGDYCSFYRISDTVGLKLYEDEDLAVGCHRIQNEFSFHDFAPKTLSNVIEFNAVSFGFLTEIVEEYRGTRASLHNIKKYRQIVAYGFKEGYIDDEFISYKDYRQVARKHECVCFPFDFHWKNVGHLRGKLVVFDFSYLVN